MPSAAPMIAASESGESMTLSGPYFSKSLSVARNTPPRLPTSSPMTSTLSSRAISLSSVAATACAIVCRLMGGSPPRTEPSCVQLLALLGQALRHLGVDVLEHPLEGRRTSGLGLSDGGVQPRLAL